jgi:hypothetical protein
LFLGVSRNEDTKFSGTKYLATQRPITRTDTAFTPLRKHKNHVSGLFLNLCSNAFLIRQAKWVKSEIDFKKLGNNYGLLKTINRFDIQHAL